MLRNYTYVYRYIFRVFMDAHLGDKTAKEFKDMIAVKVRKWLFFLGVVGARVVSGRGSQRTYGVSEKFPLMEGRVIIGC